MAEQQPAVVKGRTFEAPGKGPWELETTHGSRPMTRITQRAFLEGFAKGFAEGTAKYGVLLDHMEPAFVQSFLYTQPVAVGAPAGAMGPPPKPILQVVSRIHPEMRRRHRAAAAAIEGKLWRKDLEEWDQVDKPAAIKAHLAIQAERRRGDVGRRARRSRRQVRSARHPQRLPAPQVHDGRVRAGR